MPNLYPLNAEKTVLLKYI